MAQSKHSPAKVLCTLRQREAAEYRAQKMTLQETADHMGISKPRVSQLLDAWDENFKKENVSLAEQYQADHLEDLRLLKNDWRPQARKDLKALLAYVKIILAEADIAGSKAAVVTKTELTGSLTTVQTTFNGDEYTTEELEQLQALLSRQQSPPAK